MDTRRIAQVPAPYTLKRVLQDGTQEQISEHPDFGEGWSAGQHAVHADREAAFALYRGERRIARFCFHRLTPRPATANLDALPLA